MTFANKCRTTFGHPFFCHTFFLLQLNLTYMKQILHSHIVKVKFRAEGNTELTHLQIFRLVAQIPSRIERDQGLIIQQLVKNLKVSWRSFP